MLTIKMLLLTAALQSPCEGGKEKLGYTGIAKLQAENITIQRESFGGRSGSHAIWFGQEPRINRIVAGSPADGPLREGDFVHTVNGNFVTTKAGGADLTRPEPGRPLKLKVRRRGRIVEAEIIPEARCPEEVPFPVPEILSASLRPRPPAPPAPPAAPSPPTEVPTPAPPAAPEPPSPPPPPRPEARAWFGFGIRCDRCVIQRENGKSNFHFDTYPVIYSVDPGGPAGRAGLQREDELIKIDGLDLTSPEGSARFSEVEPGDTATIEYRRASRTQTARITAEEPPIRRRSLGESKLRYAGSIGEVDVEVRGLGPVDVTISENRTHLLIRTSDSTIRLTLRQK